MLKDIPATDVVIYHNPDCGTSRNVSYDDRIVDVVDERGRITVIASERPLSANQQECFDGKC